MSHVGVTSVWNLGLSTEEFRLVLKALGGRLADNEIDEAKLLGDTLTRQRARQAKAQMQWADKLLHDVGPCENAAGQQNE